MTQLARILFLSGLAAVAATAGTSQTYPGGGRTGVVSRAAVPVDAFRAECTQLERSAGVPQDVCGRLSLSEVTAQYLDDSDDGDSQ